MDGSEMGVSLGPDQGTENDEQDKARPEKGDGDEGLWSGENQSRQGDAEEDYGDYFGPEADFEDQFAGMTLHGKEEEDLDFSAEVEDLVKDVRWLALFRVHTTKPFSHAALLT